MRIDEVHNVFFRMVQSPWALSQFLKAEARVEKGRGVFRWSAFWQTTTVLVCNALAL
jgi:hypothetical protein